MADLHLSIDRAAGGIAGQVVRELREAVRHGRLAAGERLPASRELARDLGFSRGVIVEAYEQLVAEGFLISRVGAGTRVAPMASRGAGGAGPAEAGEGSTKAGEGPAGEDDAADPRSPAHECDYGRRPTSPDLRSFPRERWLASVRRALSALSADALDYGDPGGVPELREELAAYLRRVRGADVTPENLVIVGGVAQGLSLTVQALAGRLPQAGGSGQDLGWFVDGDARPAPRPGRVRLAVEDPTGLRQLPLLRSAGADLVAVPVDGEGVDVGALAATGVRAVLLTPAHHYPSGVVLSPRRRAELIEWAAATGATILEDDYDAEFRFDRDPVGCLQGLAPDRVVLAGSVSKSLAPGLRLGWAAAPPEIAQAVRRGRAQMDMGSPVLEQYALADFVRSGAYDRHLRRMRREYRARRDTLVRALAAHLPEITVHGVSAGLHLLAELPEGWDEGAVATAARECGLAAEPVGPMRRRPGPPALVVGFARLPVHRTGEVVRAVAERISR
ncbi:PLP-dependent aminotransferase family protein [Planobispora longispora]|uniref:aminotransferase-like domain-containing protein n=1 Tax=Planobispora longispora TaxID=28887 RepID=UPI001942C094|nr:PLP-dependent aminotransferase family protein [Planobispora longispora]